jgi:REP element-mobilizing transposase RayT
MRARRVIPGTTYHLVRRTVGRQFLLTPDATVNQVFEYALAWAAQKHGMLLHGWVAMSNHGHETCTDVHGVLPDFMRDFHRAVAMAVKEHRGVAECVWSDASTSTIELHGERAPIDAVLYGVMNPVRAGLVEKAAQWPGAIWLPGQRELVVKRPDVWFSERMPEEIRVPIVPPPAWRGSEDGWHERMAELLAEAEETLRREREPKPVMGPQRVLEQKPTSAPKTKPSERKKINPVLATGGDGELLKVLIAELQAWRRAYIEARERWRVDKTTTFPRGTWWKVVYDGAAIAA